MKVVEYTIGIKKLVALQQEIHTEDGDRRKLIPYKKRDMQGMYRRKLIPYKREMCKEYIERRKLIPYKKR